MVIRNEWKIMVERIVNYILKFFLKIFGIYSEDDTKSASYVSRNLMSDYEKSFYLKIKELENEYEIVHQLVLASVIKKISKYKYQNELFRMIDFAIFSKNYDELLLLIEINDSSHNQVKRKERDLKVKKICNDANIRLITFYTKFPNEKNYVINRIKTEINSKENTSTD